MVAVVVVAAAVSVGMTVAVVVFEAADTASGTIDHTDAEGHRCYCNWHSDPRLMAGSDRHACYWEHSSAGDAGTAAVVPASAAGHW